MWARCAARDLRFNTFPRAPTSRVSGRLVPRSFRQASARTMMVVSNAINYVFLPQAGRALEACPIVISSSVRGKLRDTDCNHLLEGNAGLVRFVSRRDAACTFFVCMYVVGVMIRLSHNVVVQGWQPVPSSGDILYRPSELLTLFLFGPTAPCLHLILWVRASHGRR